MTDETDQCRNEHSSCMTLVALGQNVKTYPTTQCKFLLILKMGVPVFIGASWIKFIKYWDIFYKPFSGLVYWHNRRSGNANKIVELLMALKKTDKN